MRSFRLFRLFLIAGACTITGVFGAQPSSGIGVALATESGALVIRQILPDSPAARSNALRIDDRIVEIGEEGVPSRRTSNLTLEQAVELVRGEPGTTVRLTIIPAGKGESDTRVVTVGRGELKELSRWGDGRLLPPGTMAPKIQWIRIADGKSEQLAEFAGKVVVLEFWATWCAPCQPIMANLQNLPQTFRHWTGKVAVISASVDETPDSPNKHLKAKGWNSTHNVWVGADAIKAYGVNTLPTTYIISQDGIVVAGGQALDASAVVNRLIGEN